MIRSILIKTFSIGAFLLTVSNAAIASENLAKIIVDTGIPFVGFSAKVDVILDKNGNLQSLSVSGNIPSMKSQVIPLKNFAKGAQVNFAGAPRPAFGVKFESALSMQDGGDLTLFALLCTGEMQKQPMVLRKVARDTWALQSKGLAVDRIELSVDVGLGSKWSGCFSSADLAAR